MNQRDVMAAVAQLRAGVDALLAAPMEGLAATELTALLQTLEVERRRLEAVDQRLLPAGSPGGGAATFGEARAAPVLTSLLRVDPREARARVGRAVDLGPRRALSGEPLEPLLPVTADAVERGVVSAAQADVIVECLERIPPSAPAAAGPVAERLLVQAAAQEYPRLLRRTAAELLARLDPDGLEPVEDRAERARSFTLVKKADGTSSPRGSWTVELTALWEAILDSLAAPQPADDGLPDDRSPAQRRHDAMAEAASRLLRSATLPAAAGSPVTVLATTTITELTAAAATALDPGGAEAAVPTSAGFDLATLAEAAGLDSATLLAATSGGLA